MRIGRTEIGPGHPVYVIAEIGVNHDGDVGRALELVDAAAGAGADAIKMQFFEADRLMSRAAKLAAYQKAAGEHDPIEMLRRLELSLDDMARVVERAHARGIHAIVSVFSVEHVEPVARLAWDAFKSASPDVINRPLLEALAATGRPLMMSTGASTEDEVLRTIGWLRAWRADERSALLQCVSCYPTLDEDAALGGIAALGRVWAGPVGYSDHTRWGMASDAVEEGASILERHLTWNRRATGPDHAASLDPAQLREYVDRARWVGTDDHRTFLAKEFPFGRRPEELPYVGPIAKRVLDCERDVRVASRQSLVATRPLSPGRVISRTDLTIKRPGTGLAPFLLNEVVGRRLARPVEADVPLTDADLA